MIEFTCSLNVLLGMAGASSSAGIKQQAANAAVHIRRGEAFADEELPEAVGAEEAA